MEGLKRLVVLILVLVVCAAAECSLVGRNMDLLKISDSQKDLLKAYEQNSKAVVHKVLVKNSLDEPRGSGTGFVARYKDRLYFITNSHVCHPDPDSNEVDIGGAIRLLAGRKRDTESDLCVARINHLVTTPYVVLTNGKIAENEILYTVGYPNGSYGATVLRYKGTEKTLWIGGFKTDHKNPEKECLPDRGEFERAGSMCLIETVMAFNEGRIIPGASGSPVFNADGDTVGVIAGTIGPYSVFVPTIMLTRFIDRAFK